MKYIIYIHNCRPEVKEMKNTVLLVVDVQTAMIKDHPYNEAEILTNITSILSLCRQNGVEVIYVRHDGGPGDELECGCDGWQIWQGIAPLPSEKIFDKNFNSAFRRTGLKEYLDTKNIKRIILVGLQTEYCIDATCKVAFEYGYEVIIPENTTSTYDNSFLTADKLSEYYTQKIWKGRYAEILGLEELESAVRR